MTLEYASEAYEVQFNANQGRRRFICVVYADSFKEAEARATDCLNLHLTNADLYEIQRVKRLEAQNEL